MSNGAQLVPLYKVQEGYTLNPSTFALNNFITERHNFDSEEVSVDIYQSMNVDAPVVKRGEDAVKTNLEKFDSKTVVPFYWKLETPIPAEMDRVRVPGESLENQLTPQERRDWRIDKEVEKHNHRIDNSLESGLWQSMVDGVITFKDRQGVNRTLSLGKPASHIVTAGTLWDAAGAKPLNDLITLQNLNAEDSDVGSDTICFGWEAFLALIGREDISKLFDNFRINPGDLETHIRANEVTYCGVLLATGTKTWVVNSARRDWQTKARVPHLDPKKVWIGSSESPKSLIGARVDHKMCPSLTPRFSYVFEPEDKSSDIVAIQASQIAVDNLPNASSTLTVLS